MLRFIIPAILWTIFVIIISVVPSTDLSLNSFNFTGADKLVHFSLYTIMSLAWITGFKRQNVNSYLRKKTYLIVCLNAFLIGFILEIIQGLFIFGRHFELLDILVNGVGCLVGILVFKIIFPTLYDRD